MAEASPPPSFSLSTHVLDVANIFNSSTSISTVKLSPFISLNQVLTAQPDVATFLLLYELVICGIERPVFGIATGK